MKQAWCFWCSLRWAFYVELFPSLLRSSGDLTCLRCATLDLEQSMGRILALISQLTAEGGASGASES